MDGYLKIKTKLDNSGLDKDTAELEKKIEKLKIENNSLGDKETGLQEEINNYEKLKQEAKDYKNKIKELKTEKEAFAKANPEEVLTYNSPEYSQISMQILDLQQKYKQANAEIDKQSPKIDKVYTKLQNIKSKQEKIEEYKQKIDKINTDKIRKGLDNVGKGIQTQIGKIGRMTLAIVGIRTAWNAVRSAINTVQKYNPQVAADFEYMKYCISTLLVPAVQWLTKLLYTVLSYVNAIANAWFGINLFGNASVKNFKKMQKSANGTAKSAKEIQKSLQGFDEMNVLQDNSSNTGVSTPSMDLSKMQAEVPAWLQWIIDNKDLILSILAGIAAGILAIKLGAEGFLGLGIGIIVAGIVETIQAIVNFIKDPSWENFSKILSGLAIVLAGVAVAMLAVNAANPVAWIMLAIAAIVALVSAIIKYWEQIKEVFMKVGQWIYDNVIQPVGNFFKGLWDKICEIFSNIGTWFSDTFNKAKEGILNAFSTIGQFFQNIWNNICNIFSNVGQFFKNVFSNAFQAIKNVFSSIGSFFSGIWSNITGIFKNIGQKIGDAVSGAFKGAVNAVLRTIENVLNTPIRAINGLIGVINLVPGINLGKLNTFNLPRLAKGGVIAQPTTAIIGESGKEAVVPLENNTEWLEKLSDMISSKIGGNSNVNVYLDGRLIQRHIAKKDNELAFATNR